LREEPFTTTRDTMERNFRHLADSKGLAFEVVLEPGLPRRLRTDHKRLLQVLQNLLSNAFKFTDSRFRSTCSSRLWSVRRRRNLLSNAFKFTDSGRVELRVRRASSGWDQEVAS